jgi:hypothetical protein
MAAQEVDEESFELDLFPASLDEGTVRQKNNPFDPIERSVITDRSPGSPYKIQVVFRTCIHGHLSKQSKTPATLMIFDYRLMITKQDAHFTSVVTSFEFSTPVASGTPGIAPSVIAYAPFEEPFRYNYSDSEERRLDSTTLRMAPAYQGVTAGEASWTHEGESTYNKRFFDQGLGGRHFDAQERAYKVWWNLTNNKRQAAGVSPTFRVAVLVERKDYEKFEAKFTIAAEGGLGYKFQHLIDRFIRRTAVDDPINLDPKRPPKGLDLVGLAVDPEELGKLRSGNELTGLSSVWGLENLERPSNMTS